MVEFKKSAIQLLDAHMFNRSVSIEVGQLMRWLTFVELVADSEPSAFEKVYSATGGPDTRFAGPPWEERREAFFAQEATTDAVRELVYCRIVDRFLYFLSMLAGCIYEREPSLLPDRKTPSPEVLARGSADDLVAERARKCAHDLSFSAPRLITETLSLAGADSPDIEGDRDLLSEAVETRNALVHRGGIVDKRLVDRRPAVTDRLGDRIVIGEDDVRMLSDLVDRLRSSIDAAMGKRHKISVAGMFAAFEDYRNASSDGEVLTAD